jgi:outer membrane protein OmpA-like peptidoglycan-associated protein
MNRKRYCCLLLSLTLLIPATRAQRIQDYKNAIQLDYGMYQYNKEGESFLQADRLFLSMGLGYQRRLLRFLDLGIKGKYYELKDKSRAATRSAYTAQSTLVLHWPRVSALHSRNLLMPYAGIGFGLGRELLQEESSTSEVDYIFVPLIAGINLNLSNHWSLGFNGEYRISAQNSEDLAMDDTRRLNTFNAVSFQLSYHFGKNKTRPDAPVIYTRPGTPHMLAANRTEDTAMPVKQLQTSKPGPVKDAPAAYINADAATQMAQQNISEQKTAADTAPAGLKSGTAVIQPNTGVQKTAIAYILPAGMHTDTAAAISQGNEQPHKRTFPLNQPPENTLNNDSGIVKNQSVRTTVTTPDSITAPGSSVPGDDHNITPAMTAADSGEQQQLQDVQQELAALRKEINALRLQKRVQELQPPTVIRDTVVQIENIHSAQPVPANNSTVIVPAAPAPLHKEATTQKNPAPVIISAAIPLPVAANNTGDRDTAVLPAYQEISNDSLLQRITTIQNTLDELAARRQTDTIAIPAPAADAMAGPQAGNPGMKTYTRSLEAQNQLLQKELLRREQTEQLAEAAEQKPIDTKVFFDLNSSTINAQGLGQLNTFFEQHKPKEQQWYLLEGYTDKSGNAAYNLKLSQRRVAAVKTALLKTGIARDRIIEKSFGSTQSLEAINSQDRKVIIRVIIPK